MGGLREPGRAGVSYLARPSPSTGPVPGVLVIQEVWGVDGHIADIAEHFATAGYAALAPDLYSVGGGRPPGLVAERVEAAKAFLSRIPPAQWTVVLGDEVRRGEELSKLTGPDFSGHPRTVLAAQEGYANLGELARMAATAR